MFVRAKKHPTAKQTRWSVLICYNKRQNKKVIQHTIKHIGIATCQDLLHSEISSSSMAGLSPARQAQASLGALRVKKVTLVSAPSK
jgi:hypothetical protein